MRSACMTSRAGGSPERVLAPEHEQHHIFTEHPGVRRVRLLRILCFHPNEAGHRRRLRQCLHHRPLVHQLTGWGVCFHLTAQRERCYLLPAVDPDRLLLAAYFLGHEPEAAHRDLDHHFAAPLRRHRHADHGGDFRGQLHHLVLPNRGGPPPRQHGDE